MGLESATYVQDLVSTNPTTGDDVSAGDDHLRLIKAALKTTFPTAGKAFYFPTTEMITADETVTSSDDNTTYIADTTSGDIEVTLPVSLGTSRKGFTVTVQRGAAAANALTVVPASGAINGAASFAITEPYSLLRFVWSGTAWYCGELAFESIPDGSIPAAKIGDDLALGNLAASLAAFLVPTGALIPWGGSATPPTGWLLADGSAVSRTTYAALFTAISTTHGAGDGSSTFNLPNMGGRVPVGYEATAANILTQLDTETIGDTGGEEEHQLTEAELAAHGHKISTNSLGGNSSMVAGGTPTGDQDSNLDAETSNEPVSESGGDQAHNNVQPSIVVPYIIKT
jgi:microcystin-dependent protein